LAIVPESPSLSSAADVLTAQFSTKGAVQLLERTEIDKVYREQQLSSENKNYLKFGQVLGADGLLLLSVLADGTNQFLETRLIAVKPGVAISSTRLRWPLENLTEWSVGFVQTVLPVMPKLAVRREEAVPISVLNLRSAQASAESADIERQLTRLAIDRLTREPGLFVLERRRLNLLASEKELTGIDESPFWNGAYLLEGTLDRAGYVPGKITLDATLLPPSKGNPFQISITGSRTNLAAVVTELTSKVIEALHIQATVQSWSASAEAERYLSEANWAWRWGLAEQAKAAADSAWALGRRDLDTAFVRVSAYLSDVHPPRFPPPWTELSEAVQSDDFDPSAAATKAPDGFASVTYRFGKSSRFTKYLKVADAPDPADLDAAIPALGLYADFCRTLAPGRIDAQSPWVFLGLRSLDAASSVLRAFHFSPGSQKAMAEKLAELRASSREITVFIQSLPAIRATYWVANGESSKNSAVAPHQFFSTITSHAALWQEHPEDTLLIYRTLMTSPVYSYVHGALIMRDMAEPRLAAWTDADRQQLPAIWRGFIKELTDSTNPVCRIEARLLALADIRNEPELRPAVENLFDTLLAARPFLITNGIETTYGVESTSGGQEPGAIINQVFYEFGHGIHTTAMREIENLLKSTLWPRFDYANQKRLHDWSVIVDRQEGYLRNYTPYDFSAFANLFTFHDYSKAQAEELRPLVSAYKSNLVALYTPVKGKPLPPSSAMEASSKLSAGSAMLAQLERHITAVLETQSAQGSPPAGKAPSNPQNSTQAQAALPMQTPVPVRPNPAPSPAVSGPQLGKAGPRGVPETMADVLFASNVLQVSKFIRFPLDKLGENEITSFRVFGRRITDGKLLLDVRFEQRINEYSTRPRAACGIWTSDNNSWDVITYPDRAEGSTAVRLGQSAPSMIVEPTTTYHELFGGALYVSDWSQIQKQKLGSGKWEIPPFPSQRPTSFLASGTHLFAANDEGIFEVATDDSSRILASCRRRPPLTVLDSRERLDRMVMFPGGRNHLRAIVGDSIYEWNGSDWTALVTVGGQVACDPFPSGAILRSQESYQPRCVWLLTADRDALELCWKEIPDQHGHFVPRSAPKMPAPQGPGPQYRPPPHPAAADQPVTWTGLLDDSLARVPMAIAGTSNLFFYLARVPPYSMRDPMPRPADGKMAELVCLVRGVPGPVVIPIAFAPGVGPAPGERGVPRGFESKIWMVTSAENLLIGEDDMRGFWALPLTDLNSAVGAVPRSKSGGTPPSR
jgi:hypothetical protein